MKILCLYNNHIAVELFDWIGSQGHKITHYSERLDSSWCQNQSFDLTVSYTYRYILTSDVIEALNNNVVNIHTSYLPFNRGADPNIWSILDSTPRGVTLHYIDAQLDHGDVIAQTILPPVLSVAEGLVGRDSEDKRGYPTLSSTYNDLDHAAKELFKTAFSYYPYWDGMRKSSTQTGSYHRSFELAEFKKQLDSYDVDIYTARKIYKALIEGTLYSVNRNSNGGGYFSSLKGENLVTAYQSGIIRRCA